MGAWAGGWDGQFGTPYAQLGSRTNVRRTIAMAFERRGGKLAGALALALNGQAVGAPVYLDRKLVKAVQGVSGMDLGGKRDIETDVVVNRNTTATDKTAMDALYDGLFAPVTYPADRGGGGGGKLGTL